LDKERFVTVKIDAKLFEIAQKRDIDLRRAISEALDDTQLLKIFSKTKTDE